MPACDPNALIAALQKTANGESIALEAGSDTYGCSGTWAFAFDEIDQQIDGTAVFEAEGGQWVPVNRTAYCPPTVTQAQSPIPAAIYQQACETD